MNKYITSEVRLVGYVVGLYTTFMTWAYLQERITSSDYSSSVDSNLQKWEFPVALNLCMAVATYLTASLAELFSNTEKDDAPIMAFWKPAMSACIASPIGYEALKYISYPLMILTKSSKPVPVMLVGSIFYGKRYSWYKYISVGLICGGISLFTLAKSSSHAQHVDIAANENADGSVALLYTCFGMLLVLINLSMDGYTNNEQDHVFSLYKASAMEMMKYTNFWQTIYQGIYLLVGLALSGTNSELDRASRMMHGSHQLKTDILMFCACASVGQVLIFGLMKEFGSLVWITVSVTRKLCTIILSVIIFKHSVNYKQWFGVVLVFMGLLLEISVNYLHQSKLCAVSTPSSVMPETMGKKAK